MTTASTPLEIALLTTLRTIAAYAPPERLHRTSEREYGVSGAEAVEMAYENVLAEAKAATRGIRVAVAPRPPP